MEFPTQAPAPVLPKKKPAKRKIFAVLLAFVLLVVVGTALLFSAPQQAYHVDVRKINWQTSAEEVQSAETVSFTQTEEDYGRLLTATSPVEIYGYPATLQYVFTENKLRLATFTISAGEAGDEIFADVRQKMKNNYTNFFGPFGNQPYWKRPDTLVRIALLKGRTVKVYYECTNAEWF